MRFAPGSLSSDDVGNNWRNAISPGKTLSLGPAGYHGKRNCSSKRCNIGKCI